MEGGIIMRFNCEAYDELFPRDNVTEKEKIESAVETFNPTEEEAEESEEAEE